MFDTAQTTGGTQWWDEHATGRTSVPASVVVVTKGPRLPLGPYFFAIDSQCSIPNRFLMARNDEIARNWSISSLASYCLQ